MGKPSKPSKVQASTISENYNWGEFGSANPSGVSLSPMASQSVSAAQSGINQYLNELINPSYDNESFRARQDLLDASNQQYAKQLGAEAIARGARGSATQNILNSIAANRNIDMRQAMTQEDARVQNILSALSGIESNYFNQTNAMGNNILQRALANQAALQEANKLNAAYDNQYKSNYDAWKNNLISSAAGIGGSLLGGLGGWATGNTGSLLGYNLWGN